MFKRKTTLFLVFIFYVAVSIFSAEAYKKIAYASSEGGNYDIYVITIDKNLNIIEKFKLTDQSYRDFNPCWSYDGKQIAYGSIRNGAKQLMVMNKDGSNKVQITYSSKYSTPRDWSPDGKYIYGDHSYPGGGDSAKFDLENKTVEMMTYVPGMNTQKFDINKNQSKIVFVRGNIGNGWTNKMYIADFNIKNYDWANQYNFTEAMPAPHGPKFSPDQEKIAFFIHSSSPRYYSLSLINTDGTEIRELKRFSGGVGEPDWIDDNRIVFARIKENNYKLFVFDLRDNSISQLIFEHGNQFHANVTGISSINVAIDIKPGGDPNSINLTSNGNVPVAVFGNEQFDVSQIDPGKTFLQGASVELKGKSKYKISFEDINFDGILDAILHFVTEELELTSNSKEAVLKGVLINGMHFKGVDSVNIVK